MNIREMFRLIVLNLNRRKGRVFLTAIGVVIGTAAVVILISLAQGLKQNANEQFGSLAQMSQIMVMPDWESMNQQMSGGGSGMTQGEILQPEPIDEEALTAFQQLPGVSAVIPRLWLQANAMMKFGKLESYTGVIGLGTADVTALGYEMKSGSPVLSKGSVIIGEEVAKNFYDPSLRPGQTPPSPPDLQGQTFQLVLTKWVMDENGQGTESKKIIRLKVAGVIASSRSEGDYAVFMPLAQVMEINDWVMGRRTNPNQAGYDMVIVVAEDREGVLEIAEEINNMGFMAQTPQAFVEGVNNYFLVLQVVFGGVGGVSLLVAAIGIANTMTMAILERTREIGLMKAVGATNQDVLGIFLGEAAGIGFIGGVGGCLLSLLLGEIIKVVGQVFITGQSSMGPGGSMGFAVQTPLWLIFFALGFATFVGLLSGLFPAVRAASLVPVRALKYE